LGHRLATIFKRCVLVAIIHQRAQHAKQVLNGRAGGIATGGKNPFGKSSANS